MPLSRAQERTTREIFIVDTPEQVPWRIGCLRPAPGWIFNIVRLFQSCLRTLESYPQVTKGMDSGSASGLIDWTGSAAGRFRCASKNRSTDSRIAGPVFA